MNTNNKKQSIRATMYLAITIVFGLGTLHGQTSSAVDKQTEVDYTSGATEINRSIRLIDNLGTVKYLQTSNGITTITNNTGTDLTTTTLQLGGELTNDTYIDVKGNVFAIDGIATTTSSASTNAVSGEVTNSSTPPVGTGYTLLVRDESTGAIEKLLLSDLDIVSGKKVFNESSTPPLSSSTPEYSITTAVIDIEKTLVYRNGIKLLAGAHYVVKAPDPAGGTDDYIIEIIDPILGLLSTADVLEVHFAK